MRRALFILGGVVGTGAILSAVMWLGAWGFSYRRWSLHQGRLGRALEQKPTADQITEGLKAEGASLLGAPAGEAALRRAVAHWGGERQDEVLRKGLQWPATRVFLAGDMVYFLYFDSAGVMKDFTVSSGPGSGAPPPSPPPAS